LRQAVTAGELVVGDMGDYAWVSRLMDCIDTVMHFAANTMLKSVAPPLKYWENNTCSTRNLLQACLEHGVKHFVFASTAAVYDMPERWLRRRADPAH
jgi:UDP-glucose 4-epimerase